MRTGILNRDIKCNEYYAQGTVKAGAQVIRVTKDNWTSWVVKNHADVPFMSQHDWHYRYITVPADAVDETKAQK